MTPEQIETLKCDADLLKENGDDLRALLAEWEERGWEIESLKNSLPVHRGGYVEWGDEKWWSEATLQAAEAEIAGLEKRLAVAAEEDAEARLAKVVEGVRREVNTLESIDVSPSMEVFLRASVERLRALAAAQPKEKR